ncbi:T-complex protein 1 subunit eta [Nematocida major]|uniref:T-complex protein 1 subunit eta n=1 Tax=Nematocida major TaxID=1912982 RepID=UPI002008D468|nr:T-complex protein 1 subunit eta [Nematocida major]KAH9385140.1 T-complex protein 1 subunit eta [Nematocida major]
MSYSQNTPVLILREETDTRFGKNQIIRNIEMCEKVANILKTTLGPNGLDKMFFNGKDILITNDGATIMKSLDIVDPAAQILLNSSEAQDRDIGDGTTSVVLLSSAILRNLKPLVKENTSISLITKELGRLGKAISEMSRNLLVAFDNESLQMLAETSLNSKILCNHKKHFGNMVIKTLGTQDKDISIKKISGGSIESSFIVGGVAFEKCFTYAGYEQQPKRILNPKIAVLKVELEWKSEVENSEMRISGAGEYSKVVSTEWKLITDRLDKIIQSGANVVLSTLSIGDYATQYFAKYGVFSAGRVPESEISRITQVFGGRFVSTVSLLSDRALARCALFEEKEIGRSRYNIFYSSVDNSEVSTASTIILRGPGAEILAEVERSLHDSMAVARRTVASKEIVAGGGAYEMEISRELRKLATEYSTAERFVVKAVSEAFEVIPFQLAKNFGHDAINTVQVLRKSHGEGLVHYGVCEGGVEDSLSAYVIEPLEVKTHMIKAALSAAVAILSIDATIVSGSKQQ